MNKIISKLFLGIFLIFFLGSVFATHVQTSEVTPTLVKGSTATTFTINVAITGDNNVTEIEITKPTNDGGFGTLTCGTPPTNWTTNGHTESICKYKTSMNPIVVDSNLDFTLNAVTATNSGTYVWNITTKDTALATDDDTDTTEVDATAPTVSIALSDSALKIGDTSTVTLTFSEAHTGFTVADLTHPNGEFTDFTDVNALVSTVVFTPTASVEDAENIITAGIDWTDTAGNAPESEANSANYTIDTVRPTVTIDMNDYAIKIGDTALITLTFSEAHANFTEADVTGFPNGALSSFTDVNALVSTVVFTPTADVEDSSNLITAGTTWADTAGNAPASTTNSSNYVVDTNRPTLVITMSDYAIKAEDTSTVTFTFSEEVTDFNNTDITTIANGTLSTVSTSNSIVWTSTFTPTASIEDSSNVITVTLTGINDSNGNAGTGTASTSNYVVDTNRPTATITLSDYDLNVGQTATVTIIFSEAVIDFNNLVDITAENGSLSAATSDDNITWTSTFTPTATIEDTSNLITLGTTWTDTNSNAPASDTNSSNYEIDTKRPTVTSVVLADTALKAGETSLVTITFHEEVTGFTNDDINLDLANGTLTDVNSTGGIIWLATFTPTPNIEDAENIISVVKTGITDSKGNAGTGSTDSENYTIDTNRPTLTITIDDTTLNKGDDATIAFSFSSEPTGFTAEDVNVANGTIGEISDVNAVYKTAVLTPTDNLEDTSNIVVVGTGWTDAALNAPASDTNSPNYSIDTKDPVVTITSLSTTDTTPTISGTIDQSTSTLTITVNGNTYSAVVDGTTWTAAATDTLAIGYYDINYTAIDAAGNSKSATVTEVLNISDAAYSFYRAINQVPRYATLIANYELSDIDGWEEIALVHLLDSSAGPDAQRFNSDDVNCAWVYSDGEWEAIASTDFDEWNFNDHDTGFVGYYVLDLNYTVTTGIKYIRHNTFEQAQ